MLTLMAPHHEGCWGSPQLSSMAMDQTGASRVCLEVGQHPGSHSCLQELDWVSPYLLCLLCWALVGRHGIWTWSPSSL